MRYLSQRYTILKLNDDDKVIFDVFKSDSTTDETTGKYSLDLKSNEMIKL